MHMDLADEGAARPARFEAINKGWVSITRPWHVVTTNTGLGNPFPATAEKGRKLMDAVVDRLSRFLIELAAAPMDEKFPY
jgi:creatinine amidohydrolase